MQNSVAESDGAETIVLQSFTREVSKKSVDEMKDGIRHVIEMALEKTKNVVVSTIIGREDEKDLQEKIDLINASIKYEFKNNERVFICDNANLNDPKFRSVDKLHLNEHGVAVFATNLKYKIAESLGIRVKKKSKNHTPNNYRNNWRNYDDYRRYWNVLVHP